MDKEGDTKWVLYAADGKYLVGDFDGKEFKPDHKEKKQLWYGRFYAAQTFDNSPSWKPEGWNGPHPPGPRARRVQIGWAQGVTFPGMPFNQQMTAACRTLFAPKPDWSALAALPGGGIKIAARGEASN